MTPAKPITIAVSLLVGSALLTIIYFRVKKVTPPEDGSKEKNRLANEDIAKGESQGESDEIAKPNSIEDLEPKFQDAADKISDPNMAKLLTQSDKLLLYGLYKQAKEGDRDKSAKPSQLNMVALAKYDAWGKFEGASKEEAMMQYIEVVRHFSENKGSDALYSIDDNDDIIYSDDDENNENGDEGDTTFQAYGMGIKPSTLFSEHEEDNLNLNSTLKNFTVDERILQSASSGNPTDLKKYIDEGGDVNATDESGQTPLHFAADKGSMECVKILLDSGANPNASDSDDISVLQTAVIGGNAEVAKLIIEAGADPDHADVDGDTPRSCAEDDGTEEMKAVFNLCS